jgi:streptogramin lyase
VSKVKLWAIVVGAGLIVGSLWMAPVFTQSGGGAAATVQGVVMAADGRPMEGVVVSARSGNETWTTSVYTDAQGRYSFPSLTPGSYSVWAQAKGFDIAKAEFNLAAGATAGRELTLRPLTDPRVIALQLDGPEWFAALPETTDQDRRMKHLLRNNCTACHGPAYTLAPRFDQRGWETIIDVMARGVPPTRGPGEGNATWQAYKTELAEYLGRVSANLQPTPGARPSGAATQVVITEFDIPRQGRPISAHTGTFWTEGQSTRYESKGARDIWVDSKGNLWVSDDRSIGRTTGRLDPRTGKWTDYALPDGEGVASSSHGIWGDRQTDRIFQGGQPDGVLLMFDTRAEQFVHYARPESIPEAGGHIDVDSQGNAWAPSDEGALKLNPNTGEYTYYPVPYIDGTRPTDRNQYGLAVDSMDNVWLARAGTESVAWLDTKTGETGHVRFEPMPFPLTEKDRNMPVGMNNGPPNGKGPRRLGSGGRNGGNFMWVALNKSDAVAKIDIRSKQVVKEYPLPPGSAPYFATVDKNGMVWVPAQNADRVFKLNPTTEQVTEFQLPTRGTDLRHLTVDDSTNPPTVWVTYNRSNKIARLQERTGAPQQAVASRP